MKFKISKFAFMADFFVYPVIALLLLLASVASLPLLILFGLALLGFSVWTLAEYFIHRYVFHSDTHIGDEHQEHHDKPSEYIGLSFFYTFAIFAVLIALSYFLMGASSLPLMFGFMVGYWSYITIHYYIHHKEIGPNSILYNHKIRHLKHHFGTGGFYGVSSNLWDKVFGTNK